MNLNKMMISALAVVALLSGCAASEPQAEASDLQFDLPAVERPTIPQCSVSVADFGGVGDGVTLSTEAFAAAIESLAGKGGGRVEVPVGVWYTGPIVLKDNIELHLAKNAIIIFSDNKDLYPLVETTFEGLNTWRCQSPLSARGAKNIAVTGEGIIDGNGGAWRAVKRGKMNETEWKNLLKSGGILSEDKKVWYPSEQYMFGATTGSDQNVSTWAKTKADFERMRDFLRPVLLSFIGCENVLLEDVTFQNSPCWHIHPAICKNLTVNNITVRCPDYAQNGDGIDVESCKNVVITNSSFDVGDDGICIKSGKDKAGRDRGIPCENILVENCIVFHGHGGFVVGSEMSGGVKNVVVRDCVFSGTDVGLRFKSTRGRGGVVENIHIERVTMNNIMQEPLLFDLFYGGKSASEAMDDAKDAQPTDLKALPVDETTPVFRNIRIKDVCCRGARRAMFFNGLPEMNVENVVVEDTHIFAQNGAEINESTNVLLRNVHIVPEKGVALKVNNVKQLRVEKFECPDGLESSFSATGSRNRDIHIE